MMLLPGEVTGELVIGQPAGWDADPSRWFEGPVEHHAAGAAYTTPGYVHERMHDQFEWTIGLGNDELGYVIPITDWRIVCVADELAGEGACAALHAAGAIPYPDAVSGEQCKAVTEDPATLAGYPAEVAQAIVASCRYGVVLGEPEDHYEEVRTRRAGTWPPTSWPPSATSPATTARSASTRPSRATGARSHPRPEPTRSVAEEARRLDAEHRIAAPAIKTGSTASAAPSRTAWRMSYPVPVRRRRRDVAQKEQPRSASEYARPEGQG